MIEICCTGFTIFGFKVLSIFSKLSDSQQQKLNNSLVGGNYVSSDSFTLMMIYLHPKKLSQKKEH